MVIDAPGFHKLTTVLYPEGDPYLSSDVISGVKKSLVVVSMAPSMSTPVFFLLPFSCSGNLTFFPFFVSIETY